MPEYLLLLIGTVFVNNIVLVKFLGLCPFMGVSRKSRNGHRHERRHHLRADPVGDTELPDQQLDPGAAGLEYLRTIAFIIAIAAVVNFTEMVVHKTSPLLYNVLGIFLPLITTNCAVLGVALINVQEQNSFIESVIYGFGAALGFSLVLILFAAMRERINVADVPLPFKGSAIGLITAGLMSLAFMGLAGLVKV